MSNSLFLKRTIILFLLQIFVFNKLELFGIITPYVYVIYFLWLPIRSDAYQIGGAFLGGLIIDMFLDSQGIHATTCVLISYARPLFLRLFYGYNYLNSEDQGVKKQQIFYVIFMVFVHHFLVFSLEFFDLSKITYILEYSLMNGIFTLSLIFIFFPFFKKN